MNTEWLPYTLAAGLSTVWLLRHRPYVEIRFFGLFKISFGDQPPAVVAKQ